MHVMILKKLFLFKCSRVFLARPSYSLYHTLYAMPIITSNFSPRRLFNRLLKMYGPQGWWPLRIINPKSKILNQRFEFGVCYGILYQDLELYRTAFRDPFFEIAVGAILTQNTAWQNVAKAIGKLYEAKALTPAAIVEMKPEQLQELIRSSGYFREKEKKLRIFSTWLLDYYKGNILNLLVYPAQPAGALATVEWRRAQLLDVWGIGPETADSILLYALNQPIFVIDAYTKRLLAKHEIEYKKYDDYQKLFMESLKPDPLVYQEYHALIVRWGKTKGN